MKVSLKKAFSLLDGRLSTDIGDVYEMLNFVFSDNLMTHQLPTGMRKIKEVNPKWFADGVSVLGKIKAVYRTNDFRELMKLIDDDYSDYEIELEKIDFQINFIAGLESPNTK